MTLSYDEFAERCWVLLDIADDGIPKADDAVYEVLDSLLVFQLIVIAESLANVLLPPIDPPDTESFGDVYDYYLALEGARLEL